MIDNPLIHPDLSDIKIIKGQDHYYWLYSNKLDMYLPTPYSYHYMTETECLNLMAECPEQWNSDWGRYDDVDI